MRRMFWTTLLSITQLISTIQYVGGSNSISSFSVKSWNTRTSSWVKDARIFPREDVRLECTTTEFSQVNELQISRADGFPLSKNHAKNRTTQSLVVILKSVECSQMGTFVCENGRENKKMVDFGIYECPPQPCKDQSTNITLYASVNMTKQFSVCVEAFPNVSSLLFFNGREVRLNKTIIKERTGVYCKQNKLKDVFSTYNILCTITVSSEKIYAVHNFSITTGVAQNQRVSFAVRIEKPGPPECPTNIYSTNRGKGNVTLSWQPVNNRGASHPVKYIIYYTTNDTEWQTYNTEEDTKATITNLKIDTVYEFRVVSTNEYRQVIDQNTCINTVEVTIYLTTTSTITTSSSTVSTDKTAVKPDNVTQDVKEVLTPIVIAVIVLAVIVVIAVVVGIIVCVKIRKLHSGISRAASLATMSYHASQRSLATPRGEDVTSRLTDNGDTEAAGSHEGSGRYISEQGLTYVTIDHPKTKPKPGKRKSEKVTYATLDPIHTGKYTVPEIPSDNQYENLRVA